MVKAAIERRSLRASADKLSAEGTNVFVDTGIDLVAAVRQELVHLQAELRAMRVEQEKWQQERRGWYVRADAHSAWDRKAQAECPHLGEPTPLFPPIDTAFDDNAPQ